MFFVIGCTKNTFEVDETIDKPQAAGDDWYCETSKDVTVSLSISDLLNQAVDFKTKPL